ncbi:MAG: class I SAM-dependent methyltransferase [Candidatus Hermodarchaeota archaeon]
MSPNLENHQKLMNDLYKEPKFPEAIDLWATYNAKNIEDVMYSNWRYLNKKRQKIENSVFQRYIKPRDTVLDIGCGKGYFLKRLYQNFKGSIEYNGSDISEIIINIAKRYFPKAKYTISPGEKLPYEDNYFDYVQIIATIEHVLNPEKFLEEAYRILKTKGYIYLVIHKKSIDPLLLSLILKASFQKNQLKYKKKIDLLHPLTLEDVRNELSKTTKRLNLTLIEKKSLVSHIDLKFYRNFKIPFKLLLGIVKLTNYIPFSLFKNLEYRIYRK